MKPKIKTISACVVIMFLIWPSLFGQTLDDYIKTAAGNNPRLKATFQEYYASLEQIPQAKTLPDPTIMFSYFLRTAEMDNGSDKGHIAVSQAFPWFGLLRSQGNAAAEQARARFQAFAEAKNKLIYDVRSVYYEFYTLEASIKITDQNIRLLKSFRELANVKLAAGKSSAVDLLRVEMELEQLNNQLLYFEDSRLPIQTRFKELLNTPELPVIQLPDTLKTQALALSSEALRDSIMVQNPSLKLLDYEVRSLENQVSVARKMGLPSFSLGFDYANIAPRAGSLSPENGRDNWIFPQVGISMPLYRKKYNALVKEQQFLQTAKVQERTNRVNELNTSLENTWRDYRNAERRLLLFERLVNLANQALNVLVAQYTSAGKDFEEILRMNRQLLDYELELEKARADQNTIVSYINYLTAKQY